MIRRGKEIDASFLKELNQFLGDASRATYAGGSRPVAENGFRVFRYSEGEWGYEDRYAGSIRSSGLEAVLHNDKVVWTQNYGGGITDSVNGSAVLADKTFTFLKMALSAGEKRLRFQPRGPAFFMDDAWLHWNYNCVVKGDITRFTGNETIRRGMAHVFTHEFFGGLVLAKRD